MAPTIRFIVHSLAQAEAALRAGTETNRPLFLESPPGAAQYWGAPYFQTMIAAAHRSVPAAAFEALLDCGAAPGLAVEALRAGVRAVRVTASPDVVARVADIAAQLGARAEAGPAPAGAFDLGDAWDPFGAARKFIDTAKG